MLVNLDLAVDTPLLAATIFFGKVVELSGPPLRYGILKSKQAFIKSRIFDMMYSMILVVLALQLLDK